MQEVGRGIGRREVINRRIVIRLRSNSAIIIISVAAAEAAASARFLLKFTRAQRRPSSSIHAFHAESEVGQRRVRRRLRADPCESLWRFSCGLHRVGRAHENGRNQQSEETVPCEFFSVLFLFCFLAVFPVSSLLNCIDSQNGNNIGDDGVIAMAEALRSNSSVQTLWLVSWFCY